MSQSDIAKEGDHPQPTTEGNQVWHRPPMITPNFGKRKKIGLKSNVSKVLLHDNVSQEHILKAQLNNLKLEERRSSKLLELHKKSFLVQQSVKQLHLRASGVKHLSILPDNIANAHGGMSKYRNADVPSAKDVTFSVPICDYDEDTIETNSRGSSKRDSATSRAGASDISASPLPEIPVPVPVTRSLSAIEPTVKPKNFMTHNYHMRREKTVAAPGWCARRDLTQKGKSKPLRALKDPRYISLRNVLIPCGKSMNGYLQLSASGQYVLQRYGTPSVDQDSVQNLIREMTTIRQSRLNSSCGNHVGQSRRPSAASATSDHSANRLVIDHGNREYTKS